MDTQDTCLKKFRKNKLAIIGSIVLFILICLSIFAPLFTSLDINKVDLNNISSHPNGTHFLGTDEMGRDIFSRLLYGGRVSLTVGIVGTIFQCTIGIILGTISGFFGGRIDFLIMRIVDIFMCFPFFVIAITLAAILGPNIWNVIIIIGILSWTGVARIVRAEILSIRNSEYIQASKVIGLNNFEIITSHIIPNVIPSIVVATTLCIADGILTEAALSFLGMGVKLPMPSWGNMLSAAQSMSTLQNQWWQWVPPGLCVLLTVLSINFIGDGLRDAVDPKQNR